MIRKLFVALLAMGLVAAGCASTKKKAAEQYLQQDLHEILIVERSTDLKDRPDWTTETFREKDGVYYFSGGIDNGHDMAVSIRQAKAEAMKNMFESVAMRVRQEFTEVVEGDNQNADLARWLSDGIAWVVDNFYVTGVNQKDIYYERIYNPMVGELTYTTFVLLEVKRADYLRSRRDAIRKLMGYFHDKKQYEAEKRAKELLDKLNEEVI